MAEDESSDHVLGLEWIYRFDTLVFRRETNPDRNCTVTEKFGPNFVSAVCDSIRIVAINTVEAQLLSTTFGDSVDNKSIKNFANHIVGNFREWSQELRKLTEITIARICFDRKVDRVKLHIFGNSSKDVFSSVVFLRGKVAPGRSTK